MWCSRIKAWHADIPTPRGATRMARGGIRLVHGLTKSTLITYYSGMKKDPKYAFLHAFFFNLPVMFFPKFVFMTKNTPFFQILHVFAPLNDVRTYSAWSWKTTLITWIFGRAWYPHWHSSGPPGPNHITQLLTTELLFNIQYYLPQEIIASKPTFSLFQLFIWDDYWSVLYTAQDSSPPFSNK